MQAGIGILGLNRSAQLGRWPWFALILLLGLLIPFVWMVAASPASLLGGQSAQDLARTGLLFGVPYSLVGGVLAVLMPVGTLLYGMMGPEKPQSG